MWTPAGIQRQKKNEIQQPPWYVHVWNKVLTDEQLHDLTGNRRRSNHQGTYSASSASNIVLHVELQYLDGLDVTASKGVFWLTYPPCQWICSGHMSICFGTQPSGLVDTQTGITRGFRPRHAQRVSSRGYTQAAAHFETHFHMTMYRHTPLAPHVIPLV